MVWELFFLFKDTATTVIYQYYHTLSQHESLPIYLRSRPVSCAVQRAGWHSSLARLPTAAPAAAPSLWRGSCVASVLPDIRRPRHGSEEHTSELQSLMRISYAVFCLKKKKNGSGRGQQQNGRTND